jgi:hypothetical protein
MSSIKPFNQAKPDFRLFTPASHGKIDFFKPNLRKVRGNNGGEERKRAEAEGRALPDRNAVNSELSRQPEILP